MELFHLVELLDYRIQEKLGGMRFRAIVQKMEILLC